MNEQAVNEALSVAVPLCKLFEGFSSKPYICPAGYPTIGYGTVYKPDGTTVTMEHPAVSQQTAETWLLTELKNKYMLGVMIASPVLLQYPQALGAIADFAYNLGVARYRSSTLKRRIDAQQWEQARSELNKWVFGGGRKLPGLVRRRLAEAQYLPKGTA